VRLACLQRRNRKQIKKDSRFGSLHIGDLITGTAYNGYTITDDTCLMLFLGPTNSIIHRRSFHSFIDVLVLGHWIGERSHSSSSMEKYPVKISSDSGNEYFRTLENREVISHSEIIHAAFEKIAILSKIPGDLNRYTKKYPLSFARAKKRIARLISAVFFRGVRVRSPSKDLLGAVPLFVI